MLSKPTRWAYSNEVIAMHLSAAELALLRALCWRVKTAKGICEAISDKELSRLTGYKGRQTLTTARKRLKSRGLIAYEHENRASDRERGKYGTSLAYVYCVRYKSNDIFDDDDEVKL